MGGDLHCHTKLSDGSASIEEVVSMAKKLGVTTIAVTDHDTQSGVIRAKNLGERIGVTVIEGLEMSCYDYKRGNNVHLLCYMPDHPARLEGVCKKTLDSRKEAHLKAVDILKKRFPIFTDMVLKRSQGSTCIYKQHIMHAIIDCGYTDRFYGKIYDFCFGRDGIAKTHIEYPDCFEVLKLIHDAGGIAVMAHPYEYNGTEVLEELIEAGLDGIECYHPSANEEQTKELVAIADRYKLLKTGGSDFHGMYDSRNITIGKYRTPDEDVQKLLNYKHKKSRSKAQA